MTLTCGNASSAYLANGESGRLGHDHLVSEGGIATYIHAHDHG
jgi:hypothetical protein